ncbi:hypothetical protein KHP62_15545 [Rhodobacteraceae bacterium NNCM2]|nr:hypothetical protein [Coraliihabitans acroporae]
MTDPKKPKVEEIADKELDRVTGGGASIVLQFDEADALFGKRTQIADSHGKFADQTVSRSKATSDDT